MSLQEHRQIVPVDDHHKRAAEVLAEVPDDEVTETNARTLFRLPR
jgi:hypothetical protein